MIIIRAEQPAGPGRPQRRVDQVLHIQDRKKGIWPSRACFSPFLNPRAMSGLEQPRAASSSLEQPNSSFLEPIQKLIPPLFIRTVPPLLI